MIEIEVHVYAVVEENGDCRLEVWDETDHPPSRIHGISIDKTVRVKDLAFEASGAVAAVLADRIQKESL